jgi:hypothetical protein
VDEITHETFNSRLIAFHKNSPDTFVMIRPDRHFDLASHRYKDDDERQKGNSARRDWFEYLAAKKFATTFCAWRAILRRGHSIMVVCADPVAFDIAFVPPAAPVLPRDFWDEFERSRLPIDRRYDDPSIRERVLTTIRKLGDALRARPPKHQAAAAPLREWKPLPLDAYRNAPGPHVSDELRKAIEKNEPR